jgi:hypothetical protein
MLSQGQRPAEGLSERRSPPTAVARRLEAARLAELAKSSNALIASYDGQLNPKSEIRVETNTAVVSARNEEDRDENEITMDQTSPSKPTEATHELVAVSNELKPPDLTQEDLATNNLDLESEAAEPSVPPCQSSDATNPHCEQTLRMSVRVDSEAPEAGHGGCCASCIVC